MVKRKCHRIYSPGINQFFSFGTNSYIILHNSLYFVASDSQANWILQYGPLSVPWKQSMSVFFLSPRKFKLSETQKF